MSSLELKDLEPISQGITSIQTKQAEAALKVDEIKSELSTAKAQTEEIKTSVETVKTEVGTVKTEVDSFKQWQIKKDERDLKTEEAVDKLLLDKKRVPLGADTEVKTLAGAIADAINDGDNYKKVEMMANGHKDRVKRFTMELKAVGDISTSNVTGSLYGSVNRPGIIEKQKRKVHVRDVVPVGTIGPGNTYTFMRENGNGEGAITTVSEGGTKPQLDFDLVETTVQVETIAGWVRLTKKAMNNIPGLVSFLQSRLPEKLLRVEDDQLLNGNGVSPNISGITHAGNYIASESDQYSTVGGKLIEAIIDDIALLEDTYERNATAILFRPAAYYSLFKSKASGSGEYNLPQNVAFVNGVLYVSGIPAYASTAVTAGTYIVGDFEMGAQLLIQNAMRIEFFEQDADNVTKNKITVRIEEDIAFPIYGSDYFILGNDPNYGS